MHLQCPECHTENPEQAKSLLTTHHDSLFTGTYLQYQPDAYFVDAVLQYKIGNFDQARQHIQKAEVLAKYADRLPLLWQINYYKTKIFESSNSYYQEAVDIKDYI